MASGSSASRGVRRAAAGAGAGDWPSVLARLNPQQLAAVQWGAATPQLPPPPLLVIAGAGTGKTATLSHRVAQLVLDGVAPDRILLMTFSRRAASEMTHRAGGLVARALAARHGLPAPSASVQLPWAGTFHSIAARLLRMLAPQLGLEPTFGVIDRGDSADLMDMARHETGLSATFRRFPRKDTCLAIYSRVVNSGAPLAEVVNQHFPWCDEWIGSLRTLFGHYVERKQRDQLLDFDDLLLWLDAALADPARAAALAARFDHVLVDEYQDTNVIQARILHALKPDGRGVTVVGDDAQSIYSFRAAEVGNILGFPQRFTPHAHRIALETNYRSTQPILDLANALIAQASQGYGKTLVAAATAAATAGASDPACASGAGTGARLRSLAPAAVRPALVRVMDDQAQAHYVAGSILQRREQGIALKRQAVLFRSSQHSDVLEMELVRRDIPYVKYGGLKFLDAAHIKDVLAVLRWADSPRHRVAAFRALQLVDGIGAIHAQRAGDVIAHGGFAALPSFAPPVAACEAWNDFADLMLELSAAGTRWHGQLERVLQWYRPVLEQRFDNAAVRATDLDMLSVVAAQYGTRERFLTEVTLDPPSATGDLSAPAGRDDDYLILSTVHSSKGQEWDDVYLLNVSDGSFPNEFAAGRPAAMDEERRLLYVAMTRARRRLKLVEPQRYYVTQQARLGATHVTGARSRFLDDPVMACLDEETYAPQDVQQARDAQASPAAAAVPATTAQHAGMTRRDAEGCATNGSVDVAARLRAMW